MLVNIGDNKWVEARHIIAVYLDTDVYKTRVNMAGGDVFFTSKDADEVGQAVRNCQMDTGNE